MERRDYLKDQIEQMGKVLGKVVADFLGLKNQGKVSQAIEIANEQMKSQLDLDLPKLARLEPDDLKNYLLTKKLPVEHFELLADFLFDFGKAHLELDKPDAKSYLQKALELLDIIDDTSKTFSLDRMNKKNALHSLIDTP